MANRNTALDDELRAYLVAHSARETAAQAGIREATRSHPAAGMQIGPEQAQFLGLLVKLIGARRAIEIGVFTGYSGLPLPWPCPRTVGSSPATSATSTPGSADRSGRQRASPARSTCSSGRRSPARCVHRRRRVGTARLRLHRCRQVGLDAYYERCLVLLRPGGLTPSTTSSGAAASPGRRRMPTPRRCRRSTPRFTPTTGSTWRCCRSATASPWRASASAGAFARPAPRSRPSASWRAPRPPAPARTRPPAPA